MKLRRCSGISTPERVIGHNKHPLSVDNLEALNLTTGHRLTELSMNKLYDTSRFLYRNMLNKRISANE